MTKAEWTQYILNYFGSGVVDVELPAPLLTDCQGDAIRWFNDRKGLRCYAGLILTGQPEYDLSALLPTVETVLVVSFPKATDIDLRAIYGDDLALPGVPWGVFPYGALQGGVYSSLVQALQYRKMASRVISADLDWQFEKRVDVVTPANPPKPTLLVTPGYNGPQGQCVIQYKSPLADISQLVGDARNEGYVLERSLIAAMERLGRIRGKWLTLPTARGEREMDGATLRTEAADRLRILNEDIASTNLAMPFLIA